MEFWTIEVLSVLFTGYLAHRRGRNPWLWGALAVVLTLLTPTVLAFVTRERPRTLENYLAQYPHCRTRRGISCAHCNSGSIRLWHQRGVLFNRAKHLCNHCGSYLYDS